jgi:formate-dependent nitrite reductase membrane component NrfD
VSRGPTGDGRNIDPHLGVLSGEASGQISSIQEERQILPAAAMPPSEGATYDEHPVIKKSVWSWSVPLYYYVGGTSGGSAVLGGAATLIAPDQFARLIAHTRWIGAVGGVVSGVLLTFDLGRPSRFLNMLRVFRPTSPMNLGSWVLTAFAIAAGSSAVLLRGPAPLRRLGDLAGVKAGVLRLALSGYTGVLVANTVAPVWQRPHRTLPLLFLASAVSGASSLLNFFEWNESEQRAIAVFGATGQLVDVTCDQVVEQQIATVLEAVRPLREGFSGFLWKAGKALTAVSLVLSLALGTSRRKRAWTAAFGTAGALCLRFGIHYAGQRSADNPRATFHQQRAGQWAYEILGRAAVTGSSMA